MDKTALISIIVPIYGVEQYLRKCIDSILAQTYTNLQIILVDDGSPDNCGAICDEYAQKDERITVIHQENAGLAAARNAGIAIAKGDYLGFVDSDDWIAPDMYEVLLASLIQNDCDVATCSRYSVRKDVVREAKNFSLPEEKVMDSCEAVRRLLLCDGIDPAFWDKLYKKEVLEGIVLPSGYVSEDVLPAYEILCRAKKIVHCAKPLYYWLYREGSLSRSSFSKKSMGLYYYFKEVRERCLVDFPELYREANYFYFKSLLVLACRIASAGPDVEERGLVNSEVRKYRKEILSNPFLKRKHKTFAWSVFLHVERIAVRTARTFGIRLV